LLFPPMLPVVAEVTLLPPCVVSPEPPIEPLPIEPAPIVEPIDPFWLVEPACPIDPVDPLPVVEPALPLEPAVPEPPAPAEPPLCASATAGTAAIVAIAIKILRMLVSPVFKALTHAVAGSADRNASGMTKGRKPRGTGPSCVAGPAAR